jgi:GlpG protein
MSGVVYGLAGHAWIRGRLDPSSGVELDESTAMFLMIWFFICFLPFMPIANTAHTFGLLVGLAWGWIAAQRSR